MSNLIRLEHNGVVIRNSDGGDFYCLTDMWKSCGADKSKQPYEWIRKEGAQFIEFIEENLKPALGRFEGIRTVRGGDSAGTWAHWQIALAYAKYLSHEFHAQCNTVIRAFAEGKLTGEMSAKDRLLERIVLSLPKPRDKQWRHEVVSSLAKVYRQAPRNSRGGAPVWLRSVQAKFSKMRFGEDIYSKLKEFADDSGARHYEHMSDDTLWAFQELIAALMVTSSQVSNRVELTDSMRQYCNFRQGFGSQLELPAMGNVCECGHSLDGHAKFCPECGRKAA